jgi:hypothetical protein
MTDVKLNQIQQDETFDTYNTYINVENSVSTNQNHIGTLAEENPSFIIRKVGTTVSDLSAGARIQDTSYHQ